MLCCSRRIDLYRQQSGAFPQEDAPDCAQGSPCIDKLGRPTTITHPLVRTQEFPWSKRLSSKSPPCLPQACAPPAPPTRRTPRSRSACPAGPASRRSRWPTRPASSRRTAWTSRLKMIPQKDRHLALASGAIQCAATTVETHVAWNANGVPIVQIFQMDKSYGADGLAVRNDVKSFADLKGKTIGVERAGHRAVLRPGLDAQQERHDAEGREDRLARAAARRAGLRGRPERRRHDLRALPVDRARQPGRRQDPGDHARLPDGDGHGRLRADLAQGQRQGRAGADQLVLRGARHDQGRPGQVQRDHGLGRQAERRAVRQVVGLPALAGQGGQPEVLRGRAHHLHEGSRSRSCWRPA